MVRIFLEYRGNPEHPERLGGFAGLVRDMRPGERFEITRRILEEHNRPMYDGAEADFALFVAGLANTNLPFQKWVVHQEDEDDAVPPDLESDSSSDTLEEFDADTSSVEAESADSEATEDTPPTQEHQE